MKIIRKAALLLAPAPVIAGSMWISAWAHSDPNAGAGTNRLLIASNVQKSFASLGIDAAHVGATPKLVSACEAKADWLRGRLDEIGSPGATSNVVVAAPFVIAGDLRRDELNVLLRLKILPTAGALYQEYFDKRPDAPVTILLFSSEPVYRGFVSKMYGRQRPSVYGFYKPSTRTIVVNVAAGEGTIAHELTHALVDFDSPALPIWLNEGLASLHEECRIEKTLAGIRVRPLINWRLGILQQSIRDHTIRSTQQLMLVDSMAGGKDEALNYAHARYFCMYLNEMGLLRDFYQLVRDAPETNRGGRRELESLVEEMTLHGLDCDFQRWVMGLSEDKDAAHASASR